MTTSVSSTRPFGSVRRLPRKGDQPGKPTGKWQVVYPCPTCGKKHPGEATFDTEARARKHLQNVHGKIERANELDMPFQCYRADAEAERAAQRAAETARKADTPFGRYSGQWLAKRAVSKPLKPRTVSDYQAMLDADILPTFEDTPVSQVTVEAVDAWWSQLIADHPDRHKRNRDTYGLLKQVMGAVVRDRQHPAVTINPCQVDPDDIAKPKPKRMQIATPEQVEAIAAEMPEQLSLFVLLAAWSGLRFGELAELRRRDVDVSEALPLLRVERAFGHRDGKHLVDTPKSDAGVRTVRLPDFLRKPLVEHLEKHTQPGVDGLLFTGPRAARGKCSCPHPGCKGGHLLNSTFHRAYDPAREAAGCKGLRVHDLRHTGATWAAQHGATMAELMRRIGHSTPQAAMIYQHAVDKRDEELAWRMSQAAKQAKKKAARKRTTKPTAERPNLRAVE